MYILDQVVSRKLPTDFDYHGVPAPWTQMKLLQLLSILGSDDYTNSQDIYKTLQDTLASSECTSNIGLGKSFEVCVVQYQTNCSDVFVRTKHNDIIYVFLPQRYLIKFVYVNTSLYVHKIFIMNAVNSAIFVVI